MSQIDGVVRWFSNGRGYGFLGVEAGPDVFVHYISIQTEGYKTLKEGQEVQFEVVQGQKGPQADKVVPRLSSCSRSPAMLHSEAFKVAKVA